jgi:FtsH-binding integral membrane protein
LRASVPDIVVANWALWVPAQFVNFAVVPLKFQVLYSNVVALVWNVYLSYTTSRNHTSLSRELATSSSNRSCEP